MKQEITSIDPITTAKVAALLGILWAVLGWLFSGIVISLLLQGAAVEGLEEIPNAFSIGGLVSGIIGGFVGGALSGYLGSLVYNLLAKRIGGIRVEISGCDCAAPVPEPTPAPQTPQESPSEPPQFS
jgi:hypothetical protein